MPDLNYSVDLSTVRPGHGHIIGIMTELEGEDSEKITWHERGQVEALNFGKIFFGSGKVKLRMRRRVTTL